MLNASITGITTRSSIIFFLLEWIVKLSGGELRMWRSRPRREREPDANDPPLT
jgi:hypothetical protein